MKFNIRLPNALKLFLILFFLFWIFTWNLPDDSDLSSEEPCTSCKETEFRAVSYSRNGVISIKNDPGESYDPVSYKTKKLDTSISSSSILIPSFKEWREMEMAKHEKNFAKDRTYHHHRLLVRRKLNYASSKCGAKILASNPKARNRMAVLSEKSDEYFLNNCKVTTWFVIELCDAVEAVQVELANYELYSSSPKEFSVFFSEVYPTLLWHHLGTFVAEDKRTMQTFNVKEKNMGKFIKVIIHSHYGKEHYCPLSVIRVLGYSMVQTLEDLENGENNIDSDSSIQTEVNSVKTSLSNSQNLNKKEHTNNFTKNSILNSICAKLFIHCSNVSNFNANHHCSNKPTCRFLGEIMKISKINCLDSYCMLHPSSVYNMFSFNSTSVVRLKRDSSNLTQQETEKLKRNFNGYPDENDIIKDYEYKKSLRIKKENKIHLSSKLKENYKKSNSKMGPCCTVDQTKNDENEIVLDSEREKYDKITKLSTTKCIQCDKDKSKSKFLREMEVATKENFVQEQNEIKDGIDSAGLINKDSVLFKLTSKIKTAETDLNFINKYLQQLSQSYRHQIEEMKTKLNKTFQTMSRTSEKTTEINLKQEHNINKLKGEIEVLNRKVNYLMKGKNELTKGVIELHGFFLILEIIIIATVFSIFLNIFKKKNASYHNRASN